jgi:hypothetical protein
MGRGCCLAHLGLIPKQARACLVTYNPSGSLSLLASIARGLPRSKAKPSHAPQLRLVAHELPDFPLRSYLEMPTGSSRTWRPVLGRAFQLLRNGPSTAERGGHERTLRSPSTSLRQPDSESQARPRLATAAAPRYANSSILANMTSALDTVPLSHQPGTLAAATRVSPISLGARAKSEQRMGAIRLPSQGLGASAHLADAERGGPEQEGDDVHDGQHRAAQEEAQVTGG